MIGTLAHARAEAGHEGGEGGVDRMDTDDSTKDGAGAGEGAGGEGDGKVVIAVKTPAVVFPPPPDDAQPLYEHLVRTMRSQS